MHRLSRQDARRVAVRAQCLDDDRPDDLLGTVRALTIVQADQTKAVAPNADLVLWSRLGFGYSPHQLADALRERRLVELRSMIRPAEDIALFRAEMDAWPGAHAAEWETRQAGWVQANDAFRRDILARLGGDGPLTSRELPDTADVPWRSSGWNNNRNAAMMLEMLELRGEVAATGERRGRDRLWDLATRVHPDLPAVPLTEALRLRDERRLRSLGIVRDRRAVVPGEPQDVGTAGEPAVVEGLDGLWRVDPAQLDRPFRGRAALLSPLDRLVFDRERMAALFAFDYQLEMYKPAASRRWGYFALPVLYGDQLVGKVDATADRTKGVLRVDAVHEDVAWPRATAAAIHDEIGALAEWLDLALDVR
ncbi:crosslink repair DNA glycosylase YcaQ family protein [Jatrophihabitans endophyticus]|uniref:DNA glycosylase AlkZ-like family protein n=1 Tax=Jatrophihabitans endophyticus TaxID=1206085 RepID=UPI001A0C6D83|nr:crosslink repair DNA glycosylase YcaQ family protein [Jatrophihabitans endophyticus]MBE7186784.1 winged helix DNA-binding domain-containing protein [Jatrophihabitans endophyticus]